MPHIRDVSGTAFVVAEFRAEENRVSRPLYQDLVVELFLDNHTRDAARGVAGRFPPVKDMVKVRTRYFDDMLERHLQSNFLQVVVLGAGLDTRAVRKRAPGVTYFEIDDAATLALKETGYLQHRLDVDVQFIPGNYVTDGLVALLDRHDFRPGLPTYIIWEGNTMYLQRESVGHVLTELREYVGRFRLSFDYMAEAVIANTTGDPGITRLVDTFAGMGAPWLSGIADIQSLALEHGLKVIDNHKTADLYRRYWPGRPLKSPIFDFYSVCTLGS